MGNVLSMLRSWDEALENLATDEDGVIELEDGLASVVSVLDYRLKAMLFSCMLRTMMDRCTEIPRPVGGLGFDVDRILAAVDVAASLCASVEFEPRLDTQPCAPYDSSPFRSVGDAVELVRSAGLDPSQVDPRRLAALALRLIFNPPESPAVTVAIQAIGQEQGGPLARELRLQMPWGGSWGLA